MVGGWVLPPFMQLAQLLRLTIILAEIREQTVLCLSYVLENICDLVAALSYLFGWCRTDVLAFIEVPDASRYQETRVLEAIGFI